MKREVRLALVDHHKCAQERATPQCSYARLPQHPARIPHEGLPLKEHHRDEVQRRIHRHNPPGYINEAIERDGGAVIQSRVSDSARDVGRDGGFRGSRRRRGQQISQFGENLDVSGGDVLDEKSGQVLNQRRQSIIHFQVDSLVDVGDVRCACPCELTVDVGRKDRDLGCLRDPDRRCKRKSHRPNRGLPVRVAQAQRLWPHEPGVHDLRASAAGSAFSPLK